MASEALHTLRFKHGSAEFELTSTAEEVASARAALGDAILAAFSGQDESSAEVDAEGGEQRKPAARKRRASRTRASTAESNGGSDRSRIDALLAEPLTNFPKIGSKPEARWAAYAVLSWAHKELDLDGLSAQDIQEFMQERWRLSNTFQAYSLAMKKRQRDGEVLIVPNTTPKVFRLMGPGEEALAKHLADQQAKKT